MCRNFQDKQFCVQNKDEQKWNLGFNGKYFSMPEGEAKKELTYKFVLKRIYSNQV